MAEPRPNDQVDSPAHGVDSSLQNLAVAETDAVVQRREQRVRVVGDSVKDRLGFGQSRPGAKRCDRR